MEEGKRGILSVIGGTQGGGVGIPGVGVCQGEPGESEGDRLESKGIRYRLAVLPVVLSVGLPNE